MDIKPLTLEELRAFTKKDLVRVSEIFDFNGTLNYYSYDQSTLGILFPVDFINNFEQDPWRDNPLTQSIVVVVPDILHRKTKYFKEKDYGKTWVAYK